MTGLWENLAGFAIAPAVLWVIAVGYGLLVERLTRVVLPNALLATTGFCASVILSLAAAHTGVGNSLAIPMVVVPAAVGLLLARRELPGRFNAGWALLAALATYVLFDLSALASGHWTWTGYNIDNDSAYELVLISHLQAHGTQAVSGPPSTAHTVLSAYLSTGYPLGSQSLLAVLSGLLGVPAAALWQGFIGSIAGIGTVAASTLSGRTFSRPVAAGAGFLAMASAIFYQYALQGQLKEVATTVAVLCALAAGRHVILSSREPRAMLIVAIPLAAILATFSAAGLPYLGALIGAGFVALLFMRRQWPQPAWLKPAIAGLFTLAVLSIPALLTIGTFFNVASSGYNASNPTAPVLGPLLRPLPLSEISGVWLYGDYRFPVPAGAAGAVTVLVTVIIFALLVPGAWRMVKAKEPGPLIGLAAMVVVLVVVYPRVTPYARGKLLMIASPIIVLAALQGLAGLRWGVAKVAAGVLALAITGAVLASDALAYHDWPVAPVDRLLALKQISQKVGARGPVLDSEFEQFAKYFTQPTDVIDGPDAPTPAQLALRRPAPEYDHSFDLNQQVLSFVESFPYILVRRSPVASPPPANYRLLAANGFYGVWQRQASPRVYAHLPLGGQGMDANARPACSAVGALVRKAPRGARLAAAQLPPAYGYQAASASSRSSGWSAGASVPGGVKTLAPGHARSPIQIPVAGRYRIWVQGGFPRTISVTLDGRTVGAVTGSNTPGGWLSAGVIRVAPGRHVLGVVRPSGDLSPGNGNTQAEIDAVALSPADQPARITFLPLARWHTLCSFPANWIEVVGSA